MPEVSHHAVGDDRAVKHAPQTIYPGPAISDGIEGHVLVEYTVSRDGRVVRPRVVDSAPPGVFDDVVLRAVASREYVPSHELENAGLQNPPSRILRRFHFELPDTEPATPTLAPLGPPPNLPSPGVELPEPEADLELSVPKVSVEMVTPSLSKPVIEAHEFLPLIKVAPIYPRYALERNLQGHVLLEFAVTTTGAVRDPVVVEAQPPGIFDRAALNAVSRFKYKPKVVEGEVVEVTGVRNRIVFEVFDR